MHLHCWVRYIIISHTTLIGSNIVGVDLTIATMRNQNHQNKKTHDFFVSTTICFPNLRLRLQYVSLHSHLRTVSCEHRKYIPLCNSGSPSARRSSDASMDGSHASWQLLNDACYVGVFWDLPPALHQTWGILLMQKPKRQQSTKKNHGKNLPRVPQFLQVAFPTNKISKNPRKNGGDFGISTTTKVTPSDEFPLLNFPGYLMATSRRSKLIGSDLQLAKRSKLTFAIHSFEG